jgi:hypothetical protein
MIIGSPAPNPGSQGNAYVYTMAADVWSLSRQISPPVSQADQAFGQKVAINSSQIFIAAPSFNSGGLIKSGAVYVYNSDGSALQQTLKGSTAYVAFGTGMAVEGSLLAIGAPQAIGREAQGKGSVYIYSNTGSWTEVAKKDGSIASETFGAVVALNGNHLAVSSPNYFTGTNSVQGRVSYFKSYSDAAPEKVFNGGASNDRMGTGLALSSSGIYIGIPGLTGRAGRVDFYNYSNTNTVYFQLSAYNATTNSDFGNVIAASGNDVVIGSRIKNDPNDNSGAAYIYRYK